ncbi:MAG: leucine-rich repeat domain-containing protein [Oscillospiraceae bacterium]|nr:leucine-rich repeat domain-containing protein [Oscillospiraceae bacterium]
MKFKKAAAIISAAAPILTLTGCGNNSESGKAASNNSQNAQSSGTTSKPVESRPAESKPTASTPVVQPSDIPVNDASAFEYSHDNELGGTVITGYKLRDGKLHIPDTVDGEKVVKVSFEDVEKDIMYIIMPNSAKEFGFSGKIRGSLQFVNIPGSVTEIGKEAFYGCAGLTSVTIGNSVRYLGDGVFEYCSNLTSVTIPNRVNQLHYEAFDKSENIQAAYKGKTYDYTQKKDLLKAINGD